MNSSQQQEPPGFVLHVLEDLDSEPHFCRLYLPTDLADTLREEKSRVQEEQKNQRHASQVASPPAVSHTARPAVPVIDLTVERACVVVPEPQSYRGIHYPVYDPYAPVEMLARSRTMSDKRDQERIEKIYKQLAAKHGNLRKIGWPEEIRANLQTLAQRLPHFKQVTEFVQGRLEVACDHDLPPRIPPILLTGDPGLGKTHYCRMLAEVLQTTVRLQPFDNAETSSQLLGSDRHWGNTHHGILFELLALGTHANPIIILDELDKTRSRRGDMDPLAPLHSILEPDTACALRDLSLEFTLDASLVTFIGTANDDRRIPETLLSRFRVFEIRQPRGADAITVAHEVLVSVLRRFEVAPPANSRKIAADLAHLPAREIFKAVEDAATRMLADSRRTLLRVDFSLDARDQPATWLH